MSTMIETLTSYVPVLITRHLTTDLTPITEPTTDSFPAAGSIVIRQAASEDHHTSYRTRQLVRQLADDAVPFHIGLAAQEVELVGLRGC